MKIYYLSESNLRHTPFMKSFVANFSQIKDKAIVIHEPFGKPADTRFVTKRISSLLSETLVVNTGLSGDQRNLLSGTSEKPILNDSLLRNLFQTVQLVVINTLLSNTEGETTDSIALTQELQQEFEAETTCVFATHAKSPIVAEHKLIKQESDLGNWMTIYEEEAHNLQNALKLAPAWLVSSTNFHQLEPS